MTARLLLLAMSLALAACVPGYGRTVAPVKGKVRRGDFPAARVRVLYESGFPGKRVEFSTVTDGKGEFTIDGRKDLFWISVFPADLEYAWSFTFEANEQPVARARGRSLGDRTAPELIELDCDLDVQGQVCEVTGGGEQFSAAVE